MTPKEYTAKARETMLPQCNTEEYLTHMTWSEIGELDSLFQREIRSGEPVDPNEVKAEIGDVLRGVCMFFDLDWKRRIPTYWFSPGPIVSAFYVMDDIREAMMEERPGDLFGTLSNLAHHFGFTLEECVEANIKKLASRKARNKIHGKGGSR